MSEIDVDMMNEETHEIVQEGQGKVIFDKANTAFYNKVQEFNRDMSINAINRFVIIWREEAKARVAKKLPGFNRNRYGTADPHPAVLNNRDYKVRGDAFDAASLHPAVLGLVKHDPNVHPASSRCR